LIPLRWREFKDKLVAIPSLQTYSTFALPANCIEVLAFTDVSQLTTVLRQCAKPFLILGGGSNTLFIEDFEGSVLRNSIMGIEHSENGSAHFLRVGAGENWHNLVLTCCYNGWHGMENLALIPGTVGAAPIQNIGAYGVEVSRFIARVEAIDCDSGERIVLTKDECQFGYRDSIFKHALRGRAVITHVNFCLPKHASVVSHYAELSALLDPSPETILEEVLKIRQAKLPDPAVLGNAGSFFKNPVVSRAHYEHLKHSYPLLPCYTVDQTQVKIPAAWLIDRLGFKGKQQRGVGCHTSQPLVLVNHGSATGDAVLSFARSIIDAVAAEFAITLEVEVQLVGAKGVMTL
jgi:UDP-N-acetylmuramate dehydrogenase